MKRFFRIKVYQNPHFVYGSSLEIIMIIQAANGLLNLPGFTIPTKIFVFLHTNIHFLQSISTLKQSTTDIGKVIDIISFSGGQQEKLGSRWFQSIRKFYQLFSISQQVQNW